MSKKINRLRLKIPKHQEHLIKSSLNPQKLIRDLVTANMQNPKALTPADHSTTLKPLILSVFFNDEEWRHVEKYGENKKSAFIFALIDRYTEEIDRDIEDLHNE